MQTVLQDGSSSTSDTGASDIEEMLQPPLKVAKNVRSSAAIVLHVFAAGSFHPFEAGAAAGQAKAAAASESRRGTLLKREFKKNRPHIYARRTPRELQADGPQAMRLCAGHSAQMIT